MPIVFVQEEGGPTPFLEWVVPDSHLPDADARDEQYWQSLCRELVDRAARATATATVNVFIVLDPEEFLERDRPALRRMLQRARETNWGARTFLVLCDTPLVAGLDPLAHKDLAAWLEDIAAGGVTDIIQIRGVDPLDHHALCLRLRDRASDALARRAGLRRILLRGRPWRCAIPVEWGRLAATLGPLAITAPDDDPRFDLLIVLGPPETPEDAEAEIDRFAASAAGSRICRVVTHMFRPDDNRLSAYCAKRGLGEPISTAGDFDLWYLLLRLNAGAISRWPVSESIQSVALADPHNLKLSVCDQFQTVLVTVAFDPNEEEHWREAAKDLGNFLQVWPPAIEYRVELAVTPQRLNALVRSMPVIDGWVHVGHGSGNQGLWVAGNGNIAPARWLQCFHGRELVLALFLTCDSDDLARHFAEQGTAVAIGFEGKVAPCKARELALGVLKATLSQTTQCQSILAGYQLGEAWFQSAEGFERARPKAYHPRHG